MISLKEKIYPKISDQNSVRKYEDLMPQLNRVKKLHYEIQWYMFKKFFTINMKFV